MRLRSLLGTVVLVHLLAVNAWGQFAIGVDPGDYSGRYRIADANWSWLTPWTTGPRDLSLNAGTYCMVNGESFFTFDVGSTGMITAITNPITHDPSSAAAGIGTDRLLFSTAPITVDPGNYRGGYKLSPYGQTLFTGVRTFNLIREMTYQFDNGASIGGATSGSYFSFTVGSTGNISEVVDPWTHAPSAAATAVGPVLNLHNILVRVTPPTSYSGYYRVGGNPPTFESASGTRDFFLIPTLRTWIAPTCDDAQHFTPYPDQVNPPTVVLTCNGIPYEFSLSSVSEAPVANAGSDQTVQEGDPVSLNGSGSSGQDLSFSWIQIAPLDVPVTLSDPNNSNPTFTAPVLWGGMGSQVLTFALTVSAGQQSSSDTVNITVLNVNHGPVADAGNPQFVAEGTLVRLNGGNSYDPDSDTLTYAWTQTAGTSVELVGASTAAPQFTAPLLPGGADGFPSEELTFQLTVSDGTAQEGGRSHSDTVTITVEQQNHCPVPGPGPDQTVAEGTGVTLVGALSSDPDNDPLHYSWTQLSGPMVDLSDAASPNPIFTAPAVGPGGEVLVFQLTVSDGDPACIPTGSATVAVTVQNLNDPPLCDLAKANPSQLWPPSHTLVPISVEGVTDPNGDRVVINVTYVTSDEPVNGLGDGDTSPDAVVLPSSTGSPLQLRAERSGSRNGRVYQIHFTASDNQLAGGSCSGTVSVEAPQSMKKGTITVNDGQFHDATLP